MGGGGGGGADSRSEFVCHKISYETALWLEGAE